MISHIIINFIGVSLGIYLSWKYNFLRLGAMIFISAPLLLWFYSTNLKRRFLIGNLVIALLSGIVPMVVVLFEIPLIYKSFPILISNNSLDLSGILTVVQFIALFAFVITLIREIIKDLEDYEGDIEYGCKTMPIVLGVAPTKIVLVIILGLVITTLGWLQYLQLEAEDWTSLIYFLVLLQMPLFYLSYRILTSKGKKDWRFASITIKFIMVAGISFFFLYAHQIQKLIVS